MKRLNPKTKVALRLVVLILSATALPAMRGGSAQWSSSPSTGDWNSAANWNPTTVPNGSSDTATFGTSSVTGVSISSDTEVSSLIFNAGASGYIITASPKFLLTLSGTGITNNSGITQQFVIAANTVGQFGLIHFTNAATAGSSTAFTNQGTQPNEFLPGETDFNNDSNAGSATFINENSHGASGGQGGVTQFFANASAANASFTNNGGSANGESGGFVYFNNNSTAANATFVINGPTAAGASGGEVRFLDTSTAANATFTNNGSTNPFTLSGSTQFWFSSTAGSATLIANGGSGGGDGGDILFLGDSTGGTARVELFGNGRLDISQHNAPGVTVGSIEGNGNVFLGAFNLVVGSNNLSTTFSGVIQDGGFGGGTGGSLTKIGSGTLTLSGANTYTGGTSVSAGVLNLSNSLALQNSTVTSGGTGIVFDSSVATHAFTFGGLTGPANLALQNNAATPNAVALTVGNNNSSGTYSGSLTAAGSLRKVGTGTLTLTGASTYTGGTTVSAGTLLINNTSGSGTGTGAVHVNGGTLGGTGIISGAVTVGTGSGAGAFISPGTSVGTLTIQSALTLNSNATFKFELNTTSALADKIVANGATISGATFSFTNIGSAHLALGASFVIIDNTSSSPISGFFSNLADNSTFTKSGNTYRVSYEGGTGNDLTITVVPEPSVWELLGIATMLVFVRTKIPLLSRALR